MYSYQTSGAVGFFDANSKNPKVSITFTHKMLVYINQCALKNKSSFAAEVRRLVEKGISYDD
jgi:hypothetical protein